MGTVEKVGLRSTRLRPPDDTSVTIPNSAITTDRVVNLSKRRKIRVLETIHVSHDVSVDAIYALRERLRGELLADPMVSEDNVRVGLATTSLYAVEIEISFYIKTTNYDEFLYEKHRIVAHLLATIEAAGVQRAGIEAAHARDAEATAMLLATNTLRQSSDYLSRFARSYAVTGDPAWQDMYKQVPDIRRGQALRPKNYESVYWDLIEPYRSNAHLLLYPKSLHNILEGLPIIAAGLDLLK